MSTILVVEDNEDMAFGLRTALEFEGYGVDVAADGAAGLALAAAGRPDLIILDLMLPDTDGYAVLRQLRHNGERGPILILTARGEEADVVLGFSCGADDYVTKPFSTAELLARIRALMRRAAASSDTPRPGGANERFGAVEVDTAARTVSRAGHQVELTPMEFELLLALLRRRGRIATRTELLREVWRYDDPGVATRTVDIHIAELRRKLEDDPGRPRHILTARKLGYRLRA